MLDVVFETQCTMTLRQSYLGQEPLIHLYLPFVLSRTSSHVNEPLQNSEHASLARVLGFYFKMLKSVLSPAVDQNCLSILAVLINSWWCDMWAYSPGKKTKKNPPLKIILKHNPQCMCSLVCNCSFTRNEARDEKKGRYA